MTAPLRICRGCKAVPTRSPWSWYCDACNAKRPGFGKLCARCHSKPSRSPTDSYCTECDNAFHGKLDRDNASYHKLGLNHGRGGGANA